jgi:acyl-CoA dehydrogenase
MLTAEEQAFLDGPCEDLCRMTNDWDITHVRADLPPQMWDFLKQQKFFGLNIPKEYGGLGFSALMNHKVIQKLAPSSSVVSSTVGVPNSLGPAELLMHYGTDEQKRYYLPRLADGREVPCFALTGPFAGSDATSIPDYGIVCEGEWNGAKVVGIKLTLNKRYITLAPVATLIGVAFRMYDPDGLLGDKKDIGISLALVPRDTAGLEIGRRHFPLNAPFQNGPIRGKDVFVPMSQLIGGEEFAGQGWRMLMECLSIGRSITLPSTASGGAKMGAIVTGAYARIRKQFGCRSAASRASRKRWRGSPAKPTPPVRCREATAAAVASRRESGGAKSTISKYHCTEMGREVARDVMDIHGGKGIILGPRNYAGSRMAGRADRDHRRRRQHHDPQPDDLRSGRDPLPSVGDEGDEGHPARRSEASASPNSTGSLFGHISYAISNAVRAWWFGVTGSRIGTTRRRRIHPSLLSQAQPLLGGAGGDGRYLDAAARRQAEIQGIAVGASRRCAQPSVHRQRDAEALRRPGSPDRRSSVPGLGDSTTRSTRSNWRCPAHCATSRSVRSAGCCGR